MRIILQILLSNTTPPRKPPIELRTKQEAVRVYAVNTSNVGKSLHGLTRTDFNFYLPHLQVYGVYLTSSGNKTSHYLSAKFM